MALFADAPIPVQFFLAFATMLGLIGATVWAVRRFASAPRGSQRLAVVDYASVIQHTTPYTQLSAAPFRDFWR